MATILLELHILRRYAAKSGKGKEREESEKKERRKREERKREERERERRKFKERKDCQFLPTMAAVLAAVKMGAPAEVAKLLQEGVDPNIPVRATVISCNPQPLHTTPHHHCC